MIAARIKRGLAAADLPANGNFGGLPDRPEDLRRILEAINREIAVFGVRISADEIKDCHTSRDIEALVSAKIENVR